MKQFLQPAVVGAVLCLVAVGLSVLDAPPSSAQSDGAQPSAIVQPGPMSENGLGNRRADELLGQAVVNAAGETVGHIRDIVVSSDRTVYAVVSVGGFLGLGETEIVIPFDQFWNGGVERILLMSETDIDDLKAMPPYRSQEYDPVPRNEPVLPR